ncbi:hypothetical protein CIK98_01285 [Prevotella sp. P2-180]|nr:hypothetical protein CIK98_01285 [Prevotella sp. P2-180]
MFSSCDKQKAAIDDLVDFSEELTENSSEYSKEEWEKAIAEYQKIVDKIDQYEYSDEELKKIGKYKTRCLKYLTKSTIKQVSDHVHKVTKQLEGALEEFGVYDSDVDSD